MGRLRREDEKENENEKEWKGLGELGNKEGRLNEKLEGFYVVF